MMLRKANKPKTKTVRKSWMVYVICHVRGGQWRYNGSKGQCVAGKWVLCLPENCILIFENDREENIVLLKDVLYRQSRCVRLRMYTW